MQTQTYTIHITPRCRRPVRGQVFLKRLHVEGDGFSFSLPSSRFRLVQAANPRVLYATDTRATEKARGVRLLLPEKTDRLFTTAIWQVTVPGEPAFDVCHVIQWLLPFPLAALMSDDTWLWAAVPDAPALSAGDWPVMEPDPSSMFPRRIRRRSFSVIDNRNHRGYIIRRFQTFPLAPLPPEGDYESLPDVVIHPGKERPCSEKND
ncbi:conjugal transfer protein TraV [Salmonella enterica]|nr:conjugal transfer protein TraV [Salmonella enterica]